MQDVSKEEICVFLVKELKRIGRVCFIQHVQKGTYPDHTFWPAALVYALLNGEFSSEEIERIRFDHEQTAESFI